MEAFAAQVQAGDGEQHGERQRQQDGGQPARRAQRRGEQDDDGGKAGKGEVHGFVQVVVVEGVEFALEVEGERAAAGERLAYRGEAGRRVAVGQAQRQDGAPAAGARQQQRIDGQAGAAPGQIAASDVGRLAGGGDVGDEARQLAGGQRRIGERRLQPWPQFFGGRQAGAPCRLLRLARQEARRAVVAGDGAGGLQRVEHLPCPLGGLQRGLLIGAADDHQEARIGRAEVGAQRRVGGGIGAAGGAQHRELGCPQAVAFSGEVGGGRQGEDHRWPAQAAQAVHGALQGAAECAEVTRGDVLAGQLRQHEAGDDGGRGDAAQGVEPKLGEAGEAREKQRAEAAGRGQHAEPDGRPEARLPRGEAAAPRLHEVVDRVIDGLADQRRAEADGDAEHRAPGQADGDDAGQGAGQHRQ